MRETFILANGLNGTEFKRTLATRGVNTFCYRFFSFNKFSSEVLNRSCVPVSQRIINRIDEIAIVYSLIEDNKFFQNVSFSDAKNIVDAIHTLRGLSTDNDELKFIKSKFLPGDFNNKNLAIVEILEKYLEFLEENDLIDNIGLINLAIDKGIDIQADFIILSDFNYTPLELRLINKVSAGNYKTMTVKEFYNDANLQASDINSIPICSRAYGTINEVESIIDDIYTNKNLDKCVVAVSDVAAYSQLFFDLSMMHDIPITFETGVSIKNSNPAKLLTLLLE